MEENEQAKPPCCRNNSGYKGVSWDKNWKTWVVKIKYNGVNRTIGKFNTKESAALEYNKYVKKYFSDKAYLNKING